MFQPLYIYGQYAAKDYMGYFLDRLLRNRPVPIPAPGIQLVSLTHVEDVASMMAKVRGPLTCPHMPAKPAGYIPPASDACTFVPPHPC